MKQDFKTVITELSVVAGFAGILALGITGCGSDTTNTTNEVQQLPTPAPEITNISVTASDNSHVVILNGNGDITECYDLTSTGDACTQSISVDAFFEAPIPDDEVTIQI